MAQAARREQSSAVAGAQQGRRASTRVRHDLLARYDAEVEQGLVAARNATSGLERVRALHNRVRPAVVVHDAIVDSVLCPLLEAGTQASLAGQLRRGCEERRSLARRFDALTRNVAAHNVYPVAGGEIDAILEGLEASFGAHEAYETPAVASSLAASGVLDPGALSAAMAEAARRSPTRVHASPRGRGLVPVVRAMQRWGDRWVAWSDAHGGWSAPPPRSARALQTAALKQQVVAGEVSIPELVRRSHAGVEELAQAWRVASGDEKVSMGRQVRDAIVLHDTVVAAVMCPVLDRTAEGRAAADRLRSGGSARARLAHSPWHDAKTRNSADEESRLTDELLASFAHHVSEDSVAAVAALEKLPPDAYRTWVSPLEDAMWSWHSEGARLLALHMASWGELAPRRAHPLLARHPTSRTLRAAFHFADNVAAPSHESAVERWLFPVGVGRPFSSEGVAARRERRAGQRP